MMFSTTGVYFEIFLCMFCAIKIVLSLGKFNQSLIVNFIKKIYPNTREITHVQCIRQRWVYIDNMGMDYFLFIVILENVGGVLLMVLMIDSRNGKYRGFLLFLIMTMVIANGRVFRIMMMDNQEFEVWDLGWVYIYWSFEWWWQETEIIYIFFTEDIAEITKDTNYIPVLPDLICILVRQNLFKASYFRRKKILLWYSAWHLNAW